MPDPTPLIHQILEQLEREGVTHIFGVPGGPLTPFFGALRARDRIRYVLARHEEGAAFMANSFARVRRELAVCCVTSGPGATNALTGVAGAAADSLPVLYLTGQVATTLIGSGGGDRNEPNAEAAARNIKWYRDMWLSNGDHARLMAAALTAEASTWPGPHIVVSGMSNNAGMPWDLTEAKAWIGYEPQDDVWAELKKAGMA